jgi:hypothetical protein
VAGTDNEEDGKTQLGTNGERFGRANDDVTVHVEHEQAKNLGSRESALNRANRYSTGE